MDRHPRSKAIPPTLQVIPQVIPVVRGPSCNSSCQRVSNSRLTWSSRFSQYSIKTNPDTVHNSNDNNNNIISSHRNTISIHNNVRHRRIHTHTSKFR